MTLFEKYSFRQKNVALLILGGLLAIVSYKRSFSTTIETRKFLSELEIKKSAAMQSYGNIQVLQKEIIQINRLLGKENVSIEEVQQSFLNFFAMRSSGLVVHQIEEVYSFDHPDFRINTFRIDLKGDFLSLLKFLHNLETRFNDARLIHSAYEVKKNEETGKLELISTLLLQNYVQQTK
jgi:hypothetical protein